MRIAVTATSLAVDAETVATIARWFQAGPGPLRGRIEGVRVRIADENGPRGGRDDGCLAEVRLRPAGRPFVRAREADLAAAVGRAVTASSRAAPRALERGREE